ncbi:TPA: Bro-N domain-containing protein, partial [Neisseria lactamica]
MQNTISVFSFKSQNVRTQILEAEPWFCLSDVAEILQIQNARQLPLKDQGIKKSSVATKKGNQELTFINEPNLYRVIFRSRKAEAVKFQDWIFEEVIPA